MTELATIDNRCESFMLTHRFCKRGGDRRPRQLTDRLSLTILRVLKNL